MFRRVHDSLLTDIARNAILVSCAAGINPFGFITAQTCRPRFSAAFLYDLAHDRFRPAPMGRRRNRESARRVRARAAKKTIGFYQPLVFAPVHDRQSQKRYADYRCRLPPSHPKKQRHYERCRAPAPSRHCSHRQDRRIYFELPLDRLAISPAISTDVKFLAIEPATLAGLSECQTIFFAVIAFGGMWQTFKLSVIQLQRERVR